MTAPLAAHADQDFGDSAPLPGRDTVKPMRPDWCGSFKPPVFEPNRGDTPAQAQAAARDQSLRSIDRRVSRGWGAIPLIDVAVLACTFPDDPLVQTKIARLRQHYLNRTGLTEAQDRAALGVWITMASPKLFGDDLFDKTQAALCKRPEMNQTAESDTPMAWLERQTSGPRRLAAGCGGFSIGKHDVGQELAPTDWIWLTDRRATPYSEIARAMDVLVCLDRKWGADDFPDPTEKQVMSNFALCGADGRRLDEAAFEKELAASSFTPVAQTVARSRFARARAVSAYLDAALGARTAKDPDLKRLLFDAPEGAWKQWEADYATWKPAVDAAIAYEDLLFGNSKKAMKGCSPALRNGWRKYVAARKPTTPEAAALIASEPIGYVLAVASAACDDREGHWWVAGQAYSRLVEARSQRGPRVAGYWAVFDALVDIRADKQSFLFATEDFPNGVKSPYLSTMGSEWRQHENIGDDDPEVGELSTVRPTRDGTLITFKTVKVTYDKRECQDTKRLWGFGANGNAIFHQSCKVVGKTTATISPEPMLVPTEAAQGLAPGQLGSFNLTGAAPGSTQRRGFPLEVWADKSKKRLVVYQGTPL